MFLKLNEISRSGVVLRFRKGKALIAARAPASDNLGITLVVHLRDLPGIMKLPPNTARSIKINANYLANFGCYSRAFLKDFK